VQSCLEPSTDLIYLTYFNAGLQIFDISQARRPTVAGYFIPDEPATRRGAKPTELVAQVEDVIVRSARIPSTSRRRTRGSACSHATGALRA
jgi:hypothetical protein